MNKKTVGKIVGSGVEIGLETHKRMRHRVCTAVIVAAGSSQRMEGENKLFSLIAGKGVLERTIEAYQNCKVIDSIVIVARQDDIYRVNRLCLAKQFLKVRTIVAGGQTRQESSWLGVQAVPKDTELIAIADGARPLVSDRVITEAVKTAYTVSAAAPGVPVTSTIKQVKDRRIVKTIPREDLVEIQTPQVFEADLIRAAMEKARHASKELTDDCMAAEQFGLPVKVTEGSRENIKITTPFDLLLAELIVKARQEQ